MDEKFDFYDLGQRYANETFQFIHQKALEYEKNFGEEARQMFELGIISLIPQYSRMFPAVENEKIKPERATAQYGVEGLRNNSYFGGTGVGVQYDSFGHYNDPENHKGKK